MSIPLGVIAYQGSGASSGPVKKKKKKEPAVDAKTKASDPLKAPKNPDCTKQQRSRSLGLSDILRGKQSAKTSRVFAEGAALVSSSASPTRDDHHSPQHIERAPRAKHVPIVVNEHAPVVPQKSPRRPVRPYEATLRIPSSTVKLNGLELTDLLQHLLKALPPPADSSDMWKL